MSRLRYVKGNITEITGGTRKIYAKEGYEIHSNAQIIQTAKNGIFYGEPKDPTKLEHPEIVEVQFLGENNEILKQSSLKNFIKATDILYGKKVKIKITTKEVKDGTKISFYLKGETKSINQEFPGLDKLKWDLEVKANSCETGSFVLNPLWYSEDLESYNYTNHITEVKIDPLNSFYVKGFLNARPFELPEKEDRLTPFAYLRNYEELIGLFKKEEVVKEEVVKKEVVKKDLVNNYEKTFIKSNSEILEVVNKFSDYLNQTEGLKRHDIKSRVRTDAKKIWELAVKHSQGFSTIATTNLSEKVIAEMGLTIEETHELFIPAKLDDRPLYWARNKMQVLLKCHPLFENDIDFEKSIVKKEIVKENDPKKIDTLEKIIQLFEEKSRNYDGIDFSKAGGKKKVLITGFDPFILNQFDNKLMKPYSPNVLQSNPSGLVALSLANDDKLGAYIQTMVVPVRYTDFDGCQENDKGQGEGIIEKYIKPFISQVDMIITVSQAGEGDYHIDVFATATRKGLNDNMDFVRVDESKSVSDNAPETIQTTLPIQMTKGISKAIYWGEYNQKNNTSENSTIDNYPKEEVYNGPGGNYLSNEIFYRVARMRSEIKPNLKTGHFHISMIQPTGDLISKDAEDLLEIVKTTLSEGFKTL